MLLARESNAFLHVHSKTYPLDKIRNYLYNNTATVIGGLITILYQWQVSVHSYRDSEMYGSFCRSVGASSLRDA